MKRNACKKWRKWKKKSRNQKKRKNKKWKTFEKTKPPPKKKKNLPPKKKLNPGPWRSHSALQASYLWLQDPVCCFGGSLILMEYKVLLVLQHVEDSWELLLLLCTQGAYTVVSCSLPMRCTMTAVELRDTVEVESESWELCVDAGNSVSSILSVNSSNHSSRLSSLFLFLFWVFGVDLHHLRGAILEDELDKSCGGEVEDETLPELVDNRGTTRGTKLSVLHTIRSTHFWACPSMSQDQTTVFAWGFFPTW